MALQSILDWAAADPLAAFVTGFVLTCSAWIVREIFVAWRAHG